MKNCGIPLPSETTLIAACINSWLEFLLSLTDKLGCGNPKCSCAFKQSKERSLYVSFSFSSTPPVAMLKPIGNPAKYLALF